MAYGSKTLPACALALAGCRTPFVYRSIGDPSAWAGGRLRRLRTATALRRAGHVVALSPRAARQIHRLYGIAPAAISVAPNARDDAVYVPPTAAERTRARATLGVEPHQRVVSLIGALTAEKRPVLAVEAAAQLSDVVLVVAGDGPCRADVERAARRLGVICHVLGVVPDVRQRAPRVRRRRVDELDRRHARIAHRGRALRGAGRRDRRRVRRRGRRAGRGARPSRCRSRATSRLPCERRWTAPPVSAGSAGTTPWRTCPGTPSRPPGWMSSRPCRRDRPVESSLRLVT